MYVYKGTRQFIVIVIITHGDRGSDTKDYGKSFFFFFSLQEPLYRLTS